MVRRLLAHALVLATCLSARAARADCADGWFCEMGTPPDAPPPPVPSRERAPDRDAEALTGSEALFADELEPEPEPAERGRPAEYGMNVRFEFAPVEHTDSVPSTPGLFGFGVAFRIRPLPRLAADLGLDFLGGRDFDGNHRDEQALVASALLFMNPDDLLQGYLIGGFGGSYAWVQVERRAGLAVPPYDTTYVYLGGHAGAGIEWRVSEHIALSGDVLGCLRGRIDGERENEPEYIDPRTRRATNVSAFALLRVGTTFYF